MMLFRRSRRPSRERRRGSERPVHHTPTPSMDDSGLVAPTPISAPTVAVTGPFAEAQPKFPFGERSLQVRSELDPRLVGFVNEVANHWDVSLIEGYRSPERQLELYNSGASKVKVGKHNRDPSHAVDMAPYPIDWNDIDQFIRFTYFCKGLAAARGLPLRNGADWDSDNDYADHSFLDWVHWEIVE